MARAAFTTLGCKVNQYETQRILESFECAGFEIVAFNEIADVYVINTCSVTGNAESKSRQTVRRASRQNPNAKVIVTGCAGQMSINRGETFDSAHLVVPNPNKLDTLKYLLEEYPEFRSIASTASVVRGEQHFGGRTRATVKIQDGCSVMCSYCSIPFTRPGLVSRDHKEVINEIRKLGKRGYREIVLTGVLIGAYGPESGSGGPGFEELIDMIEGISEIDRVRISSIEMRQVSERLIDMMKRRDSKIAAHLHIPLQAGSTKVLGEMNRPYTQSDYIRLCESLYAELPDVAITTDIMVGFPTESDEDFQETVHVCETVRFAKAHLFRFSPRFGTPADKWGDAVSAQEKQRRSAMLNEITSRTRREFVRRFVGRRLSVLVESKSARDGLLRGHTGNYIEVEFAGPQSLVGEIANVEIVSECDGAAVGELSAKVSTIGKQLTVLQ
jgi:threonylcarbamoyladenosine tRNA methylthiotransferase MtaB